MTDTFGEMTRRKCRTCGFDFFTHYSDDQCGSCQSKNANSKTVNDWNEK